MRLEFQESVVQVLIKNQNSFDLDWICERYPSIILAVANQTLIDFVLVFECPDDCSNQGTCDASNGVCNCEVGLSGDNCAGQSKQI